MSTVYIGILTMVAGTFLVNTVGITEACSTEVTAKLTEYAPLAVGGLIAAWGRFRLGGITAYGTRV